MYTTWINDSMMHAAHSSNWYRPTECQLPSRNRREESEGYNHFFFFYMNIFYLHDLEDEGRILKVVFEAEVDLAYVLGRLRVVDVHVY